MWPGTDRGKPAAGAAVAVVLGLYALVPMFPLSAQDVSSEAVVRAGVLAAADPSASNEARQERLRALVQLGAAAAPALVDLLGDANVNVRAVAAYTLGQISRSHRADVRTVDALIALLERDREPVVRMNAALALGEVRNPKAVAPLATLLDDDDPTMRRIAVVALSRTGEPAAVQPLVRGFKNNADPEIQQNALRGLGALHAVDELTDLKRSVEPDSPLWWDIEAQLQSQSAAKGAEGARQQPPAVLSGALARYFFLIRTRPYLLPAAGVLLALPALLLAIGSLARVSRQGWIVRLGVVAIAALLTVFFGGIAGLPGFAVGSYADDPTGPSLMLIPFMSATTTLPVVLCSCFIAVRVAHRLTHALLNAAIWAGVYALVQGGTWHLVPAILDGHYFFYGVHPGWHATLAGDVIAAGLTCAVTATLLRAAGRRVAWSGPLDAIGLRTYAAVGLPCCAALGAGYLIVSLYAY